MANVFYYDIDNDSIKSYDIDLSEDIFKQILDLRKDNPDSYRFYLRYMDSKLKEIIDKGDVRGFSYLNDFYSKRMAGCNLTPSALEGEFESGGIKISDPVRLIHGQIDVRNHIMTYSPITRSFCLQKENLGFAKETYYTTIEFTKLLKNQIDHATAFYKHIGKDEDGYIKEESSKEKMMQLLRW